MAHVQPLARFPAGLWEPGYVRFVAEAAGPVEQRALAEDIAVLGQSVDSHEALAKLHLLACLFESPEQAQACIATDLSKLSASDVAAPRLISTVAACGPVAEVLRTAALLEEETWRALPKGSFSVTELERELLAVGRLTPRLESFKLFVSRPLGFRGRVLGPEIWIGVPGLFDGPSARHVAWQAGHEATVAEVAQRAKGRISERSVEHVALILLKERAAAAQCAVSHREWLEVLSGVPELTRTALGDDARQILETLGSSPS